MRLVLQGAWKARSRRFKITVAGVCVGMAVASAVGIRLVIGSGNVTASGTNTGCGVGSAVGGQISVRCDPPSIDEQRVSTVPTAPPTGDGPWPFYVVNTGDLGLWVRQCNTETCGCRTPGCERLGLVRNGATVYGLCRHDSGFRPVDTSTSVWVEITWPNNMTNEHDAMMSHPDDRYRGWVNREYVVPAGHNGEIRLC